MLFCNGLPRIKCFRLIYICCTIIIFGLIVFYTTFWNPHCLFKRPLYTDNISTLTLSNIYTYESVRSSSSSKNLITILTPKISSELINRLELLDINFNDNFSTNILVMYSIKPKKFDLLYLTNKLRRQILFLDIDIFFNLFPNNFDPCKTKTSFRVRGKWNYSLMIRFWFKILFELPQLKQYEYIMRLDDDSKLTGKWINVFKEINEKNAVYFANNVDVDLEKRLPGTMKLKQITLNYIQQNKIIPKQIETFHDAFGNDSIRNYFNNFEVIKMEFFRRQEIRQWIENIDSTNGIFYYRWGDAILRYLTLAIFAEKNQVLHRLDYNLPYCHKCS